MVLVWCIGQSKHYCSDLNCYDVMSKYFIWLSAASMRFSYALSKVTKSKKSYSQFPQVCRQSWEHAGLCVCSCSLDKTHIDAGNGLFFSLVSWNSAAGCFVQILWKQLFAEWPDPHNRQWNRMLTDYWSLRKKKDIVLTGCTIIFVIYFLSVMSIYNDAALTHKLQIQYKWYTSAACF